MGGKRMQGVYVVEFAIVSLLLFTLLFGVLELGRLLFTVNALNETVRRGARLAAVCAIDDPHILHRALFNLAGNAGGSPLIANLNVSNLKLEYFDGNGLRVTSPNDLVSPSGFRAIRYVQVRVEQFRFALLIPGLGTTIQLPVFRSTLPRESLGRSVEGDTEC